MSIRKVYSITELQKLQEVRSYYLNDTRMTAALDLAIDLAIGMGSMFILDDVEKFKVALARA